MKILLSGYHNPNFITITEYVEKAIKELGHTLISFDDRSFIIPGRIRQKVEFLQRWDLNRLNNNLISLVIRYKPDLCLIIGGNRILPQTIEKIKAAGIITILWTTDPPIAPPYDSIPIIKTAPFYDFVFCAGTEAQELLEKDGVRKTYWFPFACDPEYHKPVEVTLEEKEMYRNDIVFVGSYYPNRATILEELSDFDLGIWGPGWDKIPANHPLKKHIKGDKTKPQEWIKIYSASNVILVIHYQDGKTLCYQASPKIYESLACKSFVLVDNQKDVKSLFKDGKHLVIFKDVRDLKEKIKYYLSHLEERKKIAEEGYKEVIQKHTYKHWIEQLVDIISSKRTKMD